MEKLVKKKALIVTIITILPCLIIGQLIIITGSKSFIIINSIFLLMLTILAFAEYNFLKMAYRIQLSYKENIKKGMEFFKDNSHVEVIPIKDEPNHERFVTEHLSKKAKFYATNMEDGTAMISIKFNGDNEEVYYGGLKLDNLPVYFEKNDY